MKPILYVSLILRTAMFEHTTGNYGHFISSLKIKTTFTLTCWLDTSACSFVSFILPYNNLKRFWIHLDPACTCELPAHLQCQTETAQTVSLTVVCVWLESLQLSLQTTAHGFFLHFVPVNMSHISFSLCKFAFLLLLHWDCDHYKTGGFTEAGRLLSMLTHHHDHCD